MAPKFQVISFTQSDTHTKEYKRRQPHHKTRSGCMPCKVKRVKCDQTRPICQRCQRNNRTCCFPQEEAPKIEFIRLVQSQQSWRPVARTSLRAPSSFTGPEHGTSRSLLLRHFGQAWRSIFDVPRLPVDIHSFSETSYLQRTLLAISASHLRHKTRQPAEHRVAEAYQQYVALTDFRRDLARPLSELSSWEIDSLVMTSMLLNMLIFTLPSDEDEAPANREVPDPAKSWVFSDRDDRLRWLSLVSGLRPLLVATRPYREGTMLGPLLDRSDDWARFIADKEHDLNFVPDAWLQLCQLERGCGELAEEEAHDFAAMDWQTRNVYLFREPLRLLADLRSVEPLRANVFRYLEFIGKLGAEFRQLLFERDERAMWVIGYWMGLMKRFGGLWWCDRRVARDFLAIIQWFDYLQPNARAGSEGEMWRELLHHLSDAPFWSKPVLVDDATVEPRSQDSPKESPAFKGKSEMQAHLGKYLSELDGRRVGEAGNPLLHLYIPPSQHYPLPPVPLSAN